MPQLVALSLSIAVLGAVWAFLALGPLSGFVLVWAGFIAWGCFFHTGGGAKALGKTIPGTAHGAFVASGALFLTVNFPTAGPPARAALSPAGGGVFFGLVRWAGP